MKYCNLTCDANIVIVLGVLFCQKVKALKSLSVAFIRVKPGAIWHKKRRDPFIYFSDKYFCSLMSVWKSNNAISFICRTIYRKFIHARKAGRRLWRWEVSSFCEPESVWNQTTACLFLFRYNTQHSSGSDNRIRRVNASRDLARPDYLWRRLKFRARGWWTSRSFQSVFQEIKSSQFRCSD